MATLQEIDAQIAYWQDADSRTAIAKLRDLQNQRNALTASDAELQAQLDSWSESESRSARTWAAPYLAEQKRRAATATLANPSSTTAQKWAAQQVVSPVITAQDAEPGDVSSSVARRIAEANKSKTIISDEQAALANAHAAQNTPQWQAAVNAYNTGEQVPNEFVPLLNQLNSYFTGGEAAPGNLAAVTGKNAIYQWGRDAQPGGFDKFMNVALPIAAGVLTGGVGGLGAMAGGAVAGGTAAGMQGGGLGDIAKGALTGGALAYGGGMLADYAGLGSAAGSSGSMAAPGSAADVIASMGGPGGGVTAAQEAAGMLSAAGAPGVAASTAAGNVATGLGYDMLGTAATGGTAGLGANLGADQIMTTTDRMPTGPSQKVQQLTAEQVASLQGNPEAIAQYAQAGMIPAELMSTLGTTGTSWMDYLSTGLGLVQGVQGILGGNAQDAAAAQRAMDPFAPYRAQYAQQLNQLMADPSTVTQLPGYQFQQQQGQQGVQRALAAQGRTVSGQEQLELQRYNEGLAGQAYTDQYNKLAQLSGANQGPGAGGAAFNQTTATNQQAQQAGWGQLGTLASGAMTPNTPINRAVTGAGDYLSNLWR